MRSAITGRSYDELQNAYRFRTLGARKDKTCGCNFSLYYKEMMRREAYIADPVKREPKQSSIVWVKPELRGQLEAEAKTAPVPGNVGPQAPPKDEGNGPAEGEKPGQEEEKGPGVEEKAPGDEGSKDE